MRPADKGVCECDRAQQQSVRQQSSLVVPCSSSGSSWFILSEFSLCVPLSRFVLSPVSKPTRRYPISVIRRHIVIGCTRRGRRRRSRSRHTAHQSHQFAPAVEAAQRLPGSSRARTCSYRRASRRPSGSRSSCPPVTPQQQRDRIGGERCCCVSRREAQERSVCLLCVPRVR